MTDDEIRLQGLFQHEMLRQATWAVIAYDDLQGALAEAAGVPPSLRPSRPLRVWSSVQSFLCAAGSVERLSRGKYMPPGRRMEPGLAKAVADMRNNLEHFDARLLKWYAAVGPSGNYIDANVGRLAIVEPLGPRVLRNLDPNSMVLTFLDDALDLPKVVDEIKRIRSGLS